MTVWIVKTWDEIVGVFDNEEAARLCQDDDPAEFHVIQRTLRSSWASGDWDRSFQGGPLP